jgi:RHS repeat-associated protein
VVPRQGQPYVRRYYTFNGKRIAMREGTGGLLYLLQDHLGSTVRTSDRTGADRANNAPRYDAYGNQRTPSLNALPTDLSYTGQRRERYTGLVEMGARWYDPVVGSFLSADTIVPDPANPQSLSRYAYSLGNPLKYKDPTGHWVETAWDVLNIAWDIAEVRGDPSAINMGALAVDVGAAILPAVPAGAGLIARGGKAAKAGAEVAAHGDDLADAAKVVTRLDEGSEIAIRGLDAFKTQTYFQVRKAIAKAGESALEAHHLIEKRLAKTLDIRESAIASIALSKEQHQAITNAWRKAIGYNGDKTMTRTATASLEDIWSSAQDVYANRPELLEAIKRQLFER